MKMGTKVQLKGTKRTGVVLDQRAKLVYVIWKNGIGCWSHQDRLEVR